uniref:TOG domain-containing protein n=1 Tax=Angiostrongylus cantonensis TaxID=6313 RepID=A0A158P7D2_ANGCA
MDSLLEPLHLRADRIPSPAFMPREDDYAELLRSSDFDVRLQTLNRLPGIARRDPEWFTNYPRKGELFKNFDRILADDRWEVQHQCIKFLQTSMTTFGSNLEYCMCYLMPNLIPKLGNSKITVRKITAQAIQAFLRHKPEALGSFLLVTCDWSILLDTLTKLLATSESEFAELAALVAKKLEVYLGKSIFTRMLDELSASQQKDYARFSKNVVVSPIESTQSAQSASTNRSSMKLASGERRLRFGMVPSVVAAMLKQLIEDITSEEISRLVPHLHSYLISLSNVLSELNFKVVILGLDVVRLTVNRLKSHMEAHLQQVVTLLAQHFGNQKAIVKQLIMMTFMDLFQNINPKAVVGALCVYLENKNSRIREEVLNILTSALMITSSSRINFTALLNMLVPLLLDPKRRVRLAAFEQLSVVGYMMNGKVDILLKMVRDAEGRHSARGLTNAVMARLRRQTLPRIRYDGLIDYSTPPVNDSFGVPESELADENNLDLNWILYAGENAASRPISPLSIAAGVTKGYVGYKSHKTTAWVNGKVCFDNFLSEPNFCEKLILVNIRLR